MLSILPIVWFKKFWDFLKSENRINDVSIAIFPRNRYLKSIYDFSFDIMSNATLRIIIYLVNVLILVIVSLLHLVRDNQTHSHHEKMCTSNSSSWKNVINFVIYIYRLNVA
jgi:hypothetical protein